MERVWILGMILVLSGCLKLEVKPDHVVADAVDAGKELYTTIKRKNDGKEERLYSHTIPSSRKSEDAQNVQACKKQVLSDIKASVAKVSKVISESSEVIEGGGYRRVKCSVLALVKPKKK